MPTNTGKTDYGTMDENNYAVVNGKKYPIKYCGPDANTYEHKPGCLTEGGPNNCCQCGALERAAKVYGVYVPGEAG